MSLSGAACFRFDRGALPGSWRLSRLRRPILARAFHVPFFFLRWWQQQHVNSFIQSIIHSSSHALCLTNGPDRRIIQVTRPEQRQIPPPCQRAAGAKPNISKHFPKAWTCCSSLLAPKKKGTKRNGTKKSEQLRGLPSPCPFREARGALSPVCLSILFFLLFFVLLVVSLPFVCAFLLTPGSSHPTKAQTMGQTKQAGKQNETNGGWV